MPSIRWAAALLALSTTAAAQNAPNPNRPTPTFDSVAPALPPLKRPAILIFSKTNAFRHDSIAQAVPAIEKLVRARGWSSYATENAAVFNPNQLARFDAVVFASATGDWFTPEQRAASNPISPAAAASSRSTAPAIRARAGTGS
jgi:hypothetical protein